MPIANVDLVVSQKIGRLLPVAGGRVQDGLGKGHTFETHKGIDIYHPLSRSVRAPADLKILSINNVSGESPDTNKGAAGPIFIEARETHGPNKLRFLHMDKVIPIWKEGSIVHTGQKLGTFWPITFNGKEGHLHFEVRGPNDEVLNPIEWLKGKQDLEKSQIKVLMMLGQDDIYNNLSVGQSLYSRSGHELIITEVPGYPFLWTNTKDIGEPIGKVTANPNEAGDWVLDDALALTNLSQWATAPQHARWKLRIEPYQVRIPEVRKLSGRQKYDAAWALKKEILQVKGESVLTSATGAAKEMAQGAKDYLKNEAKGLAGSLWDSIPLPAKIGGGALIGLVGYSYLKK